MRQEGVVIMLEVAAAKWSGDDDGNSRVAVRVRNFWTIRFFFFLFILYFFGVKVAIMCECNLQCTLPGIIL